MAEFAYPNLEGLDEACARDGYAIVRQVIDGDLVAEGTDPAGAGGPPNDTASR